MAISAKEYLTRLNTVSKITVLRDIAYTEIKAKEEHLRQIKEKEYEQGNIYSNGTKAYYSEKSIYPEVSKLFYWDYKHNLNPIAGTFVVDLMLTGRFISSFYLLKPIQNRYLWGARDSKRNLLVKDYGIDIMGLNQNTFNIFQKEIITPLFIKQIKTTAKIG